LRRMAEAIPTQLEVGARGLKGSSYTSPVSGEDAGWSNMVAKKGKETSLPVSLWRSDCHHLLKDGLEGHDLPPRPNIELSPLLSYARPLSGLLLLGWALRARMSRVLH
jgi:hypothetical protein